MSAAGDLGKPHLARRRPGLVLAVSVVVLLVTVAAVVVVLGGRSDTSEPPRPSLGWEAVSPPPLSARYQTATGWTGTEALFVGGIDDPPQCVGFGGCFPTQPPVLNDGAVYNPTTDTWRAMPPAPEPVGAGLASVMTGDRLIIVATSGDFLMYDASQDTWTLLPAPPSPIPETSLAADGDTIYALPRSARVSSTPTQVLDLATGAWSALPPSTNTPVLSNRTLLATTTGLVVIGEDIRLGDSRPTYATAIAERWNGQTWSRYPPTMAMSCCTWHWTGSRVVSPTRITVRGFGERAEPDAARTARTARDPNGPISGALDPATGAWSTLPPGPADQDSAWSLTAAAGNLIADAGFLYDDTTATWTPIPQPRGSRPYGTSTVITGDQIIVFGGYNDVGLGDSVTTYQPTRQTWTLELAR